MTAMNSGPTFVVVTGNPQEGQGKRLSEIRSHMAKRHHQHRIQNKDRTCIQPDQIDALIDPLDMLGPVTRKFQISLSSPPLPPSPTGYNRMQQFMYQYVHQSHQIHPFFATVICAAVSHPALMSSKILNASAWDDISTNGNISYLTFQQCNITRRLLCQTLNDKNIGLSDMNIAALIAVLLFDLIADEDAFCLDYQGLWAIIDIRGGMENLGFEGFLKNGLLLIEELKRVVEIMPTPRLIAREMSPTMDMSLFTLEAEQKNAALSESSLIRSVLDHLYHSTMALGNTRGSPLWLVRLPPITTFGVDAYPSYDDARVPALLQTIQILNWYSCSSDRSDDLSRAFLDLKNILENTDLEGFWNSLPGALIWCLIIGVRLCPPGPLRTWYLMQTARVSCTMAMHHTDRVFQSLHTVLEGLDGGQDVANTFP